MFLSLFHLLCSGNIECDGFGIFEQSQNCHYDRETRDECGPPPNLILDGTNLTAGNGTTYCACRFSGGKRVCAPCEHFPHLAVLTFNWLLPLHLFHFGQQFKTLLDWTPPLSSMLLVSSFWVHSCWKWVFTDQLSIAMLLTCGHAHYPYILCVLSLTYSWYRFVPNWLHFVLSISLISLRHLTVLSWCYPGFSMWHLCEHLYFSSSAFLSLSIPKIFHRYVYLVSTAFARSPLLPWLRCWSSFGYGVSFVLWMQLLSEPRRRQIVNCMWRGLKSGTLFMHFTKPRISTKEKWWMAFSMHVFFMPACIIVALNFTTLMHCWCACTHIIALVYNRSFPRKPHCASFLIPGDLGDFAHYRRGQLSWKKF